MNKIIKGYNEFIKKNEEFQDPIFNEEEANIEANIEANSPIDEQPIPNEGGDDTYEEEAGYIGDRAMGKLAETLGTELLGNTISYENAKIEYVAEFDGFLVKGAGLGVKKVPVAGGDIQSAVDKVLDLLGSSVLSEKKEIKEKAKPIKKTKEDKKKSKDDEDKDDKKLKNLKSFKKKK